MEQVSQIPTVAFWVPLGQICSHFSLSGTPTSGGKTAGAEAILVFTLPARRQLYTPSQALKKKVETLVKCL